LINEIEAMQEDIRKLREDIDNSVVKRDSGVARIASMQKELRGTIAQIDLFTGNKDRKGLLMAGADRAIRELLTIFKDDPIEVPLEEASMSVDLCKNHLRNLLFSVKILPDVCLKLLVNSKKIESQGLLSLVQLPLRRMLHKAKKL
jgi:hypothetical protein